MCDMRGLFIHGGDYATIDFELLESLGCTDIFSNGAMITSYDKSVQELKNVQNAMSNTNLKLWFDSTVMYSVVEKGWVTPENTTHTQLVAELLNDLLNEPDLNLEGFSADDFCYHPTLWVGDQNTVPGSIQETKLCNFAQSLTDVAHENNYKILGNGTPNNVYGITTSKLAGIFDYWGPQIYKFSTNARLNTDKYIRDTFLWLNEGNTITNMIPGLVTFNTGDNTSRTVQDIHNQIKMMLNENAKGYMLFDESRIPPGLTFISRRMNMVAPNLFMTCIG